MSGMFRPISDLARPPRGRRLVLIVWLFVGIVVCLLVAAVYSVELLSAGRAFVGAEVEFGLNGLEPKVGEPVGVGDLEDAAEAEATSVMLEGSLRLIETENESHEYRTVAWKRRSHPVT